MRLQLRHRKMTAMRASQISLVRVRGAGEIMETEEKENEEEEEEVVLMPSEVGVSVSL